MSILSNTHLRRQDSLGTIVLLEHHPLVETKCDYRLLSQVLAELCRYREALFIIHRMYILAYEHYDSGFLNRSPDFGALYREDCAKLSVSLLVMLTRPFLR